MRPRCHLHIGLGAALDLSGDAADQIARATDQTAAKLDSPRALLGVASSSVRPAASA